jgi:hypothetical protein
MLSVIAMCTWLLVPTKRNSTDPPTSTTTRHVKAVHGLLMDVLRKKRNLRATFLRVLLPAAHSVRHEYLGGHTRRESGNCTDCTFVQDLSVNVGIRIYLIISYCARYPPQSYIGPTCAELRYTFPAPTFIEVTRRTSLLLSPVRS